MIYSFDTILKLLFIVFMSSKGVILPSNNDNLENMYSDDFFKSHLNLINSYKILANFIKNNHVSLNSILDIGCGHGLFVESLRQCGFISYGIEGSKSAINMWPKKYLDSYKLLDLRENVYSDIPKTDIVICTEVAEHLPKDKAQHLISIIVSNKPEYIYFSAATFYQDMGQNPGHINEQPFMYWLNIFHSFGYCIDVKRTHNLKVYMMNNIENFQFSWWYPKNLFILKKGNGFSHNKIVDFDYNINLNEVFVNSGPPHKIIHYRDFMEYKYCILKQQYNDLIEILHGENNKEDKES